MKNRWLVHKEVAFVLLLLAALPFLYNSMVGGLTGNDAVGFASLDLGKCAVYEKSKSRLREGLANCLGCDSKRQELVFLQSLLDEECATACSDGVVRCRISASGDTQWQERCVSGNWQNVMLCYNGCIEGSCIEDDFVMSIRSEPESVRFGRSSLIVVELKTRDGRPIRGVPIRIGSDVRGVFLKKSLVTDEEGFAKTPYIAAEEKTSELTAQATVGDIFKTVSAYVFVKNGS